MSAPAETTAAIMTELIQMYYSLVKDEGYTAIEAHDTVMATFDARSLPVEAVEELHETLESLEA